MKKKNRFESSLIFVFISWRFFISQWRNIFLLFIFLDDIVYNMCVQYAKYKIIKYNVYLRRASGRKGAPHETRRVNVDLSGHLIIDHRYN